MVLIKEVTVIEEENGHPTKVQFRLDENKELINVNFYYGGSSRASTARLQLKIRWSYKSRSNTRNT